MKEKEKLSRKKKAKLREKKKKAQIEGEVKGVQGKIGAVKVFDDGLGAFGFFYVTSSLKVEWVFYFLMAQAC